MSIKQKLQNPFVLGIQGFAIGAALFFSTANKVEDEQPAPAAASESAALIKSIEA
jgi:hypothetical protein